MKDGNGCIAISTVTVNPIITLSAKLDKNITCFPPAAAQITLTAAGGNNGTVLTPQLLIQELLQVTYFNYR
jgi:hypothetical protein